MKIDFRGPPRERRHRVTPMVALIAVLTRRVTQTLAAIVTLFSV